MNDMHHSFVIRTKLNAILVYFMYPLRLSWSHLVFGAVCFSQKYSKSLIGQNNIKFPQNSTEMKFVHFYFNRYHSVLIIIIVKNTLAVENMKSSFIVSMQSFGQNLPLVVTHHQYCPNTSIIIIQISGWCRC